MIRLATVLSSFNPASARPSPKTPAESSAFALALGSVTAPAADGSRGSPAVQARAAADSERQDPAMAGNDLPDAGLAALLGLDIDGATGTRAPVAKGAAPATPVASSDDTAAEFVADPQATTVATGGRAETRASAHVRTARQSSHRHTADDPTVSSQSTRDPELLMPLALAAMPKDVPAPAPALPISPAPVPAAPAGAAFVQTTPAGPSPAAPAMPAIAAQPGDASLAQPPVAAAAGPIAARAQPATTTIIDAVVAQLAGTATAGPTQAAPSAPAAAQGAPVAAQPVVNPLPAASAQVQSLAALAAAMPGLAPAVADPPRSRRDGAASAGIEALFGAAAPAAAAAPNTVQPTGDGQQPGLDLQRHDWMASMIDYIETLRDADGGKAARIRLSPDALGTVDVSLRQDGATLHVHFASETAATRTLLGDAAPGLAQLAEARGIRIAQPSVETGSGSGQPGSQRQDAPRATSAAPPSASADADDETDQRIA